MTTIQIASVLANAKARLSKILSAQSDTTARNSPTRGAWKLAIAGAIAGLGFAQGAAAQSNIASGATYSCDFENSYCDFYEQSKVASSGARRSTFVSSAASGARGVKLTTLVGDSAVNGSGTWERNDLSKPADASYCNPGQEEWWAFSIMFPSDFVFPPGPEAGIIMDFHQTGSSGQANYEIQTIPGIGLRARGYGGASVNSGQFDALIPDPYGAAKGTVARNQWYHFVLHVKWSPNGDGFMQGWVNGKRYQNYTGATLYAGQACYLKLANYHGPYGQASSIIHDRVVRGTSAAAVSHLALEGVGNTPTTPTTPPPTTTSYTLSTVTTGSATGTVTSAPSGINCGSSCSTSFASGSTVTLLATPASGASFSGWSGACSGTGACTVAMSSAKSVTATFASGGGTTTPTTGAVGVSTSSLGFGGASGSRTVTYTNNTSGKVTFVRASLSSAKFAQTNTCGEVNPGGSCTATVTYASGAAGTNTGTFTMTSTAPNSPHVVSLDGGGSGGGASNPPASGSMTALVPHFYRNVLRREADAGGKAFWEGEISRVANLGADPKEGYYAMAMSFFASGEYAAFNRSTTGFVSDLYTAFFNRSADSSGLSYWAGQIDSGMPREVALAAFMFSAEFASFVQGYTGNVNVRAEVNLVMDLYRGLLSRLPDSGGFLHSLQQLRAAQCQGAAAVNAAVDGLTASFMGSGEYAARARGNGQFIGDNYNTVLRRGGDLGGVQYWIGQLNAGQSRDTIRRQFVNSPEFTARVNAVIAQGCAA